jgi:NADPH-dependent 2,4-dienoyl-CoA reductase/sulfur reductase-like enzyme
VLVVGAGPAGLEAARVLASLGHRVRSMEGGPRTGGALRATAAGGPARERMALLADWLDAECRRLGVEILLGARATTQELDALAGEFPDVVLATGARPGPPPALDGMDGGAGTSSGAGTSAGLGATGDPGQNGGSGDNGDPGTNGVAGTNGAPHADGTPPEVVGVRELYAAGPRCLPASGPVAVHDPVGGPIGVAVAEWLAAEGREVLLITPDQTAGTMLALTGDLADANTRLQRAGVERVMRSRARATGPGRIVVEHVWTGERRRIACTAIVDCGFELPEESLYLARPGTPRAGDCVAPRTVMEAVLEGRRRAFEIVAAFPEVTASPTRPTAALTPH